MNKDIVNLNIRTIIGSGLAMGSLYVYRELDNSEQEIDVDIEFDYQPAEKADLEYCGCEEFAEITRVTDSQTGSIEYNLDAIDNLLDAGTAILEAKKG